MGLCDLSWKLDNTEMLLLLLNSTCTAGRPFLFSHCSSREEVGSLWEVGIETQPGQLTPNWFKGYSRPYKIMLSIIQSWRKKKDTDVCSDGVSLPMSLLHVMEFSFLLDENLPAYRKQWINSLFFFALPIKLPLSHKYQQLNAWILDTKGGSAPIYTQLPPSKATATMRKSEFFSFLLSQL